MDGDTRGGAALSVRGVSGKPIKFVGVGEGCISMNSIYDWTLHCILVYVWVGLDDLEPFYPERMASRILGMGDIQSFIEKAQSAIDFGMSRGSIILTFSTDI